jgi:hypothetical protein
VVGVRGGAQEGGTGRSYFVAAPTAHARDEDHASADLSSAHFASGGLGTYEGAGEVYVYYFAKGGDVVGEGGAVSGDAGAGNEALEWEAEFWDKRGEGGGDGFWRCNIGVVVG